MYHILPKSQDNILGIRIEGRMEAKDYATLLPFVENLIAEHGSIRIFVDLRDFESISFGGVLKILPYAFKYSSHVEKKAVVTDKKWIYAWVKLLAPFFKTKVHCFPSSEVEQAWKWVRN